MNKRFLQDDKRARIRLRTRGRPREIIRKLALAMLVTMALAAPAVVSAMEVDIPYEQDFTNDSARASVADSFDYRLTADDSAPMPAGSSGAYDFTLNGDTDGVLRLDITYPTPGYYYYTVKSNVNSPQKGYSYESKVYKVMVMVINGTDDLVVGAVTIQDANLDKYDRLLFQPSYYEKRPEPNPPPEPEPEPEPDPNNGGGNNPGGGNAGGNPNGAVPGAPADGNNPAPAPPTTIDDPEPPLAGVDKGEDYWALINLIAMILTWLTAIVGIILYIRRRDQASKLEDQNEEALKTAAANGTEPELEEIEDPQKLKRKGILRIVTIVVAIISLILFILTEDMTLPMELVDRWTIWMIIILIIALLLALISRKVTEEPEEEPGEQPEPTPGE